MGRPWICLSVCSLIRITNEGRLRTRGYPSPLSGGSIESRLCYWDPVPDWDKFYGPCDGRLPCDGRCVWSTWGYRGHDLRSMPGDTVREACGREVSLEKS